MELISRQAAIEVIDAVFPVNPTKSEYAQGLACGAALAKTYVKQLPSAQPRWIPVTERLPKENGMYLVTMTEKAKAEELGFDLDEIEVSKMRYNSNGWQLPRHIPSWINEVVKDEVIAWMPLPEPYREEEQDE